jgi:hypothetical protein
VGVHHPNRSAKARRALPSCSLSHILAVVQRHSRCHPHRYDGVRGVAALRALPIMHGAVSGLNFARLLSCRVFLVYDTSRPIRTSETPQLVAARTRSASPGWELIRYQDAVSPGAVKRRHERVWEDWNHRARMRAA